MLQGYNFAEEWQKLDYLFTNHVETTRIELKHELQDQLSPIVPQPNHMLSSSHDIGGGGDGDVIRPRGAQNLEIRTILYYAGHILAAY